MFVMCHEAIALNGTTATNKHSSIRQGAKMYEIVGYVPLTRERQILYDGRSISLCII